MGAFLETFLTLGLIGAALYGYTKRCQIVPSLCQPASATGVDANGLPIITTGAGSGGLGGCCSCKSNGKHNAKCTTSDGKSHTIDNVDGDMDKANSLCNQLYCGGSSGQLGTTSASLCVGTGGQYVNCQDGTPVGGSIKGSSNKGSSSKSNSNKQPELPLKDSSGKDTTNVSGVCDSKHSLLCVSGSDGKIHCSCASSSHYTSSNYYTYYSHFTGSMRRAPQRFVYR